MYRFVRNAAAMSLVVCASTLAAQTPIPPLILTMALSPEKAMGGETVTGTIRASSAPAQNRVIRLEASPTGLLKFNGEPELVLPAGQTSVGFSVSIVPASVKTSVTIRAVQVGTTTQPPSTSRAVEIFPALIRVVRVSAPTMLGTRGASVTATVELNAAAPPSGISLYPLMSYFLDANPSAVNAMTLGNSTAPRVAAGSRTVSIPIPYNEMRVGALSVSDPADLASGLTNSAATFNASVAHVAFVVGIDPPTSTAAAQVTPGLSGRVTFNVLPLRVTSSSVQPASVPRGSEALATFTLSGPAGSNDVASLSPGNDSRVWARLVGTSCQGAVPTSPKGAFQMPLTAGATTQSFKVCTAVGATTGPTTVRVSLRSGEFPISVTIIP